MGSEFFRRFGDDEEWFAGGYHFNQTAVEKRNLSTAELEQVAARLFSQCDYVRKVWTRAEMEATNQQDEDTFRVLFWKSFHPDRSPNLLFQMEKYYVGSPDSGTSHGSPYRYDTHVPIAFLLPGMEPARIKERVATADIAPTVAKLLGIEPPETVDGQDLSAHFLPPSSP
jgi:hypothetical protein